MTLKDFTWYCFVALVYIITFGFTAFLLVADWRLVNGRANPPWVSIFIISLLGPFGLLAAFTVYFIDKVRHGD